MKKVIILFLVMLCLGCVKVGKELPANSLNSIVVNKTTKAQMLAMFGQPLSQSYDTNGKLVMNWHYQEFGPFAVKTRTQMMTVLFDDTEVVEKYTLTDSKNL